METPRLTDQQRQLVADNHNLIYAYLHSKHLPVDDFYDLAAVGLCRAALAYDPARGKFSTLAYKAMSNEVGTEFRIRATARRTADVVSLDALYQDGHQRADNGFRGTVRPIDPQETASPEDMVDTWHLIDRLRALASDRDRHILAYRMLGYTNNDIAPTVGLSRGGVAHAVKMIRHRLGVLA